MPPTRPTPNHKPLGPPGPSFKGKGKPQPQDFSEPPPPGISKIKSSLRQTRRLLAKDSLAPDVRVETERRLKSLEADLEAAQRRIKERNLAVRYHKIKFFERQKVLRKIEQTKRKLAAEDIGDGELKQLKKALVSHRVDLNYILHYPKTEKYVSLFPADAAGVPETVNKREGIRKGIRKGMKRGEFHAEPEMGLGGSSSHAVGDAQAADSELDGEVSHGEPSDSGAAPAAAVGVVAGDEFFEASAPVPVP